MSLISLEDKAQIQEPYPKHAFWKLLFVPISPSSLLRFYRSSRWLPSAFRSSPPARPTPATPLFLCFGFPPSSSVRWGHCWGWQVKRPRVPRTRPSCGSPAPQPAPAPALAAGTTPTPMALPTRERLAAPQAVPHPPSL